MNKAGIRARLKKLRNQLSPKQIETWSHLIYIQLGQLQEFQLASNIAAYAPLWGEVNLMTSLMSEHNKTIYLPVIEANQELQFYRYTKDMPLEKNQYQILEPSPQTSQWVAPQDIDLILIPMLGFDLQGSRLGMGQGYYDRFLTHATRATKLGLAFACQQWPHLPQEPHDITMDMIITEQHMLRFKEQ